MDSMCVLQRLRMHRKKKERGSVRCLGAVACMPSPGCVSGWLTQLDNLLSSITTSPAKPPIRRPRVSFKVNVLKRVSELEQFVGRNAQPGSAMVCFQMEMAVVRC